MKYVKDYNPREDPRLIDCKTECGNDKCYARRYGLFAEKTCQYFVEPKPITNADRIRAMSDEELAKFLHEPFCDKRTHDECTISYCGVCDQCVLDWLQQPCEGGE